MWSGMKIVILSVLGFMLVGGFFLCEASYPHYKFVVQEAGYKRLCKSKKILTVNGQFPGPTLYAHKGDTVVVDVYNSGKHNITIHWHGVKQPRNPWSDGPEYVTQCPIQPGNKFSQTVIFSEEEGTIWWHAHSDWSRATVHGAIFVFPKHGTGYPFPKPHAEVPIIFGEWWKKDVMKVLKEMLKTGGDPRTSDAYTINGQPGDLYPCSKCDTFKLNVEHGKIYLLRFVNAAMNDILFFAIAKHNLTIVGADGSYTKPLTSDYVVIAPGQTLDCLLHANQQPDHYYMAARTYTGNLNVNFDNTTTTAIVQYKGCYTPSSPPLFPYLPYYNDTAAAYNLSRRFRSLANDDHPLHNYPSKISTALESTISINNLPCSTCEENNGSRFAASMNNISFVNPEIDILEAYHYHIKKIYGKKFPGFPPYEFNFTGDDLPESLLRTRRGTEVKVLEYNSTVEMILQNTELGRIDHPMHLHGYSFYVVGLGFGNFNKTTDPSNFNLVDPPLRNTVSVPVNGWVAIRFKATNPGVWFMHCHFERHSTWGMDMVFIVKDGKGPNATMLPPPPDMPPC